MSGALCLVLGGVMSRALYLGGVMTINRITTAEARFAMNFEQRHIFGLPNGQRLGQSIN